MRAYAEPPEGSATGRKSGDMDRIIAAREGIRARDAPHLAARPGYGRYIKFPAHQEEGELPNSRPREGRPRIG